MLYDKLLQKGMRVVQWQAVFFDVATSSLNFFRLYPCCDVYCDVYVIFILSRCMTTASTSQLLMLCFVAKLSSDVDCAVQTARVSVRTPVLYGVSVVTNCTRTLLCVCAGDQTLCGLRVSSVVRDRL